MSTKNGGLSFPRTDPYKYMRYVNTFFMLVLVLLLVFTHPSDRWWLAGIIGYWILGLESAVLLIASEIRALRYDQYDAVNINNQTDRNSYTDNGDATWEVPD